MLKKTHSILFLTIIVCLGLTATIHAKKWKAMSYEELISTSELIVAGKVIWINNEPVSTNSKDEATIMVNKVLKGKAENNMVGLVYPGVNKGYQTYDGKFQSVRTHDEVFFDIEQEGVWFLKSKGKKFCIDHPARFKPLFFLPKIQEVLNKQKK